MNVKDFISSYGEEAQKVTRNYCSKSLAPNYHIKDAMIEFCDNAYDARFDDKTLNIDIIWDTDKNILTIVDNGSGIIDDTKLFDLGATNKEKDKNKIGKYGIGVPGAVSAIAKCIANKDEIVEVVYETVNNNGMFIKHVAFSQDGEMVLGKTSYYPKPETDTYTKITFNNVTYSNMAEIYDAIEEVYEEPLHRNVNISFNGRRLCRTEKKTFVGDESVKTIMVGDFATDVKYRIIGGDSASDREFEEAGLRVYDKNTGRLLAKSTQLWSWYCDKQAQQNICGLRCAIYIESSIESYNKFGIKPEKNGVTYSKYFKSPDFAELAEELKAIYLQGAKTKSSKPEGVYELDGRTYEFVTKMDEPYACVGNNYFIRKKWNPSDMVQIINTIAALQLKCEKLELKKSGR